MKNLIKSINNTRESELKIIERFNTEYDKNIPVYSIESETDKIKFWNNCNKSSPVWSLLKEAIINDLLDDNTEGEVYDGWNYYSYEVEEC